MATKAQFTKGQTAYLIRETAKEVIVRTVVVKAAGLKVATIEGFSGFSVNLASNDRKTLFTTLEEAKAEAEFLATSRNVTVVVA